VIIAENQLALDDLLKRLEEWNKKQDEKRNSSGIHTSDLVLCLKQSAYKRIIPKKPSVETLGYYVDGNTSDRALKALFKQVESECVDGIWLTPDAEDDNGIIQEFKATRSNNGLSAHFGKQLSYYLAQKNRTLGRLVVRRLNRKYPKADNWKPFQVYDVLLEEEELPKIREEIRARAEALKKAIEQKNPDLAPGVRHDPESNWLCNTCLWKSECWKMKE
jgi:hypothetical protein